LTSKVIVLDYLEVVKSVANPLRDMWECKALVPLGPWAAGLDLSLV
jgi:hypothetical protein